MVNKVTLLGRLGSDPEVRTLESGAAVAKFSVATSENYRDRSGEWQEQTEWHDVVVWRQLAERAQEYLKKGSLVYLEGKLSHRKWQDKEGNNRRTTEVVASYFRIMPTGQRSGGNYLPTEEPPATAAGPPPRAASGTSAEPASAPSFSSDEGDPDGDDLPF